MSDWGMRWPKNTKDKAVADGKYLVGFEATGKHLKAADRLGEVGFAWATGKEEAWALADFVAALRTGKTPREAFDAAWPDGPKAEGEQITLATGATS